MDRIGILGGLVTISACATPVAPEPAPDAALVFPDSAPCLDYEEMHAREFRHLVPYIEQLGGKITIAPSPFDALWGEVDPVPSGSRIWAPQRLHWIDGTTSIGIPGRLDVTSTTCVWAVATSCDPACP